MTVEVKRLQEKDAELARQAIHRIKMSGSGPTAGFTLDYMCRFLRGSENVLIVATEDSLPVGFALAYGPWWST